MTAEENPYPNWPLRLKLTVGALLVVCLVLVGANLEDSLLWRIVAALIITIFAIYLWTREESAR